MSKDVLALILLALPLVAIIFFTIIAMIFDMIEHEEWKGMAIMAAVGVWLTLVLWLLIS